MKKSDISQAFCRTEIESRSVRYFAGRRKFFERLRTWVSTPGSVTVIHGERKIGKSSFARILQGYLSGELDENLDPRHEPAETDFKVVFHVVSDYGSATELLAKILSAKGPDSLSSLTGQGIVSAATRFLNRIRALKMPGVEISLTEKDDLTVSVSELFIEAAREVSTKLGKRLVVIIDEMDDLQDSAGLGRIIKALHNDVTFVLVGIANTYTDLIADHKSVEDLLTGGKFHVRALDRDDVQHILDVASMLCTPTVTFTDRYFELICDYSGFFPGPIVQLGWESLYAAHDRGLLNVSGAEIDENLFWAGVDQLLTDGANSKELGADASAIVRACNTSPRSTRALKAFSELPFSWLTVADIEPKMLASERGKIKRVLDYLVEGDLLLLNKDEASYRIRRPILRAYIKRLTDRNQLA